MTRKTRADAAGLAGFAAAADAIAPHDSAALYDAYEATADGWRARLLADLGLGNGPALTEADHEDLVQEARIALWEAARSYGAVVLMLGPHRVSFADYARPAVRGSLREYLDRWFADRDFARLPDLAERPYESIFCLWPESDDPARGPEGNDDSLSGGSGG